MDIQEALKTMRALANGIDPERGQRLEADSIYLRPPTIKALNRALSALAQRSAGKNRPSNAYRTWTRRCRPSQQTVKSAGRA
jgi:hypothetical protein